MNFARPLRMLISTSLLAIGLPVIGLPLLASPAGADTTFCYYEPEKPVLFPSGNWPYGEWMEAWTHQECFDELFDVSGESCLLYAWEGDPNHWHVWGCSSTRKDWTAAFERFRVQEWEWCWAGVEDYYYYSTRGWWRNMDHHGTYEEIGYSYSNESLVAKC